MAIGRILSGKAMSLGWDRGCAASLKSLPPILSAHYSPCQRWTCWVLITKPPYSLLKLCCPAGSSPRLHSEIILRSESIPLYHPSPLPFSLHLLVSSPDVFFFPSSYSLWSCFSRVYQIHLSPWSLSCSTLNPLFIKIGHHQTLYFRES